jgi:hypothetical protein
MPETTGACVKRPALAALAVVFVCHLPGSVSAQTVEVTPLAGYRFGGDLFEVAAGAPVDLDGAPVVGGAVKVEMGDGLWFEALFTHQEAHINVPVVRFGPLVRRSVAVDHWLAGGRQDFGSGRVLPFVTGLVGLTHYRADGDDEIRFAVGAGGGMKLSLARRLGLRFDSRVFSTFVDAEAHAGVCTPGACVLGLRVNVAWQFEFTVDAVVAF